MGRNTISTMEAFAEVVKTVMEGHFGEDYKVELETVIKNNGIKLTGLIILNNTSNVAPAVYLESYFERYKTGASLYEVCEEIIAVYEGNNWQINYNPEAVMDFNKAKAMLFYKVISAERNQELLKSVPHIVVYDLAVVFYVLVSSRQDEVASIMVRNEFLEQWGIDKKRLLGIAMKNTPRLFRGKIESFLQKLTREMAVEMGEEIAREFYSMMVNSKDTVPMYICSNTTGVNGASAMFYPNLLKDFADEIGSNLYILPSSIHEVVIVPDTGDMDADELRNMVKIVNNTEVQEQEVLSDNVYYYNRFKDKVELA